MILALKTEGATTQAWLYTDVAATSPTATLKWESDRDLSEQLLGRLTAFLADHKAKLPNLTGIIIFSGPGSFTSLRIGHTVVNALADSLGIPVAGAPGDDWQTAALKLLASTPIGRPALPHYGAEAHITRPKS